MQRVSDQLLAGTALTADQHRDLQRCDLHDLGAKPLHGGAVPHDAIESVLLRLESFGLSFVVFNLSFQSSNPRIQYIDNISGATQNSINIWEIPSGRAIQQ
jgi:hypothetical protein